MADIVIFTVPEWWRFLDSDCTGAVLAGLDDGRRKDGFLALRSCFRWLLGASARHARSPITVSAFGIFLISGLVIEVYETVNCRAFMYTTTE